MSKSVKYVSIDNEKSEKAALITFEGDEYKQPAFLPKSIIEVDEAEKLLTCSIDEALESALEKAKEENTFKAGGDGNRLVEIGVPDWDVEGRASVGFDISISDAGHQIDDFKVRVFLPKSKIEDGKIQYWLVCSSVARRIAEESKKKFNGGGIAEAIIENPKDFVINGIIKESISGNDLVYQMNKAMNE